jgi:nitrate reductase NapE component
VKNFEKRKRLLEAKSQKNCNNFTNKDRKNQKNTHKIIFAFPQKIVFPFLDFLTSCSTQKKSEIIAFLVIYILIYNII